MDLNPFSYRFCKNEISFERPKVFGAYSVNKDRHYINDMSNIKYLKIPEQPFEFDLNEGDYIDKPQLHPRERIHHLFQFIMDHESELIKNKRVNANFVCFRGALRYLLATPYEKKQSWLLDAVNFNGTIYFCLTDSEEKKQQSASQSENDKKFGRYGFKFESYIMAENSKSKPKGKSEPVIEAEEFCIVMTRKISSNINVLFGIEIDGVESKRDIKSVDDLRSVPLIEVKTRRREYTEQQKLNTIKFNALAWFCQSYIAGIDEIYIGYRDEKGIVNEIKKYDIRKDLLKPAEKKYFWKKSTCLQFLKDFLKAVQKDMKDIDNAEVIFRYSFDPKGARIHLERNVKSAPKFFTEEYINFLRNT